VTSAAVALGEERSVVLESLPVERMTVDAVEVANRSGVSAKIALATIALVQVSWLGALGYFAFAVLR